MKKLSDKLYKKILKNMPICCIDGLLHYRNKFILFKRSYEPAKNRWWIFGGRLNKEESLADGVLRKAKEELGIKIKIEKLIGTYETTFKKSRQGIPVHTVNIVFLVTSSKKPDFSKAEYKEFSKVRIFDKINKAWHPYIKQIIKDSGILK